MPSYGLQRGKLCTKYRMDRLNAGARYRQSLFVMLKQAATSVGTSGEGGGGNVGGHCMQQSGAWIASSSVLYMGVGICVGLAVF